MGSFEVDLSTLELHDAAGVRVELPPLAFDLLGYLIEHRDRVVPKDELFDTLWGEVAVSPSSLSQAVWAVRRALGDTGGAQRVIKNVRGRGYRLVADVERLEGDEKPAAPRTKLADTAAARGEPGLVGRREELQRLEAALHAASAGQGGRVLLLSGWAGMGKSRLAAELVRSAEHAGVLVCQGRCYAGETMPPFWPWQQIARDLLRRHPPEQLSALVGEGAADLQKLIPELREGVPDVASAPQRALGQERFHLFEALRALLEHAAAERPLLLLIDDLHCADEATLRCLEFLAPALPPMRVLLLCALRPPSPGTELEPWVAAFVERHLAAAIELLGLTEPEVAALLRAHGVGAADPPLLRRVLELTSGNPLFVTQLAGWLAAHPEAAARGQDYLQLPGEARAVLRQQIMALSGPSRELLQLAAVLGDAFHLGDLRRAEGTRASDVVARLEPVLERGLIRRDAEDVGAFRFAHPSFRAVIYEDLPHAQRVRLHHRAAEGIAQAHADDPTSRLSELAHHAYQAATSGCAADAVRYCRLAAERAHEATAFEEAVTQYRRALHALELVDPVDPRDRSRLLLGLGDAMRGAAMPVEEVRKVFADAARQAVRASDSRLLAEAAMRHAGRGPMRVSVLREAGTVHSGEIALLEQALSAVGAGDSAERALLQAWLAYSLYNSERREERKALARSAVQVARRVGDGPVLAECLMLQQHAVRGPAELDARIAALGEILELGRTYDLLGLQFDARCERAWAYWERCMPAEAEADMLEMQRLAESSHQRREKRAAAVWRAMKLDADGRFEDAEAMLAESDRDQPKDGRVNQGRAIRQFMISALRGRSGEMLPSLEAIAAKFPLPVAWHCGLVSSYAYNGRLAEAARELDRLALDDFAAIPDDHNWITSHAQLCGPCRLLGDKARAAVLYRTLLPYADRMCVVGLHGFCGGVTHRALAECAITLGELDAAERHLARAIEEDTRVGARIWATSGRISHAMLLLERGGRADRARACEQLSAALAYARSRGLSDLVARAEELTESRSRRPLRGSA